jgi:hypothetical protein
VDKNTLTRFFPNVVIQPCQPFRLNGVGQGPIIDQQVDLDITLSDTEGRDFSTRERLYVVDKLSPGLILGLTYLKPNKLNVIWGDQNHNDKLQVGDTGRIIRVLSQRKQKTGFPGRKTAAVRAAGTYTIQPGTGMALRTRHRELPITCDGYLVQGRVLSDPRKLSYASLMSGIVSGQSKIYHVANFGSAPITVREGQLLGHLHRVNVFPDAKSFIADCSDTPKAVPLSAIVGDVAPEQEEDDRYGYGYPFNLPDEEETIDLSKVEVPNCWGPVKRQQIMDIIRKHRRLFRPELGKFNDGVDMPVHLDPGADLSNLNQRPYFISRRDREDLDKILDPLCKMGVVEKVPLGEPSPIASPAFIVRRKGKPRCVVDLRRINTKVIGDAYPLPRQDEILGAMNGSTVFTALDVMKGFFQQPLRKEDRYKTAFVTPHRGHERFTVSTMGLKSSPAFFQHRMESLFAGYLWQFVLVYIDDIIIFSRGIEDHLRHLDTCLGILAASGCTMSLDKCHFAQPDLKALGHHVSRLGLQTQEEKTEAIGQLAMPDNLKDLESGLGLMGYYRGFIQNYAGIADPLNEIKTLGFKGAPAKGQARDNYAAKIKLPLYAAHLPQEATPHQREVHRKKAEEMQRLWRRARHAWKELKKRLCEATELAFPDYDKPFILRVDSSKLNSIGAGLHQIQDGKPRPILFLSRKLTDTEKRYGICEIETLGVVWALKKLTHYLDHSKVLVLTDHEAIAKSFNNIPQQPRGTYRLVNWRLFLARYADRITIRHVPGKQMTDVDAISRLRRMTTAEVQAEEHLIPEEIAAKIEPRATPSFPLFPVTNIFPTRPKRRRQLPKRYQNDATGDVDKSLAEADDNKAQTQAEQASLTELNVSQHGGTTTTFLHISQDLQKAIADGYEEDKTFRLVHRKLQHQYQETKGSAQGPALTYHTYRLNPQTGLIYYMDGTRDRVAIPSKLRNRIMETAHDERTHLGVTKTHGYLRSIVFFPDMYRQIKAYIDQCPHCRAAKADKQKPFGDLQPIVCSPIPLSVVCMDFVVGLPTSKQDHDACLVMVCKASKFVRVIIGKETFSAADWARLYVLQVYADWGLPDMLISDMDPKFVSALWTSLCRAARIDMRLAAAHHHAANGQAEITIQTFEQCLVTALGARLNFDDWEDFVGHVVHCINTSPSLATSQVPYEVLYGRRSKSFLPIDLGIYESFTETQDILRQEAHDTLSLTQTRMKAYFDDKHRKPPRMQPGDLVYIKLAKPGKDGYHLNNQTKLSFRRVGPYPIAERISDLRYRVKLPPWLKWHPEISVEHLVPAFPDKLSRPPPGQGPLVRDGQEKWIIEDVVEHAVMKKPPEKEPQTYYRIKWMGYNSTTWEPRSSLILDVPALIQKYDAKHGLHSSKPQATHNTTISTGRTRPG